MDWPNFVQICGRARCKDSKILIVVRHEQECFQNWLDSTFKKQTDEYGVL